MPKTGMEPIRRAALVKATIAEIGHKRTLDITVGQIARRAGMSSGLAHHYFGGKDQIFLAAMRHMLTVYGRDVRAAMEVAKTPDARLRAIIQTGFSPANFRAEVIAAWLNFYVLAQTSEPAGRLLRVYRRRLVSNLAHQMRPALGDGAPDAALRLAGLIDGLYLHAAQGGAAISGAEAAAHAIAALDHELRVGAPQGSQPS